MNKPWKQENENKNLTKMQLKEETIGQERIHIKDNENLTGKESDLETRFGDRITQGNSVTNTDISAERESWNESIKKDLMKQLRS